MSAEINAEKSIENESASLLGETKEGVASTKKALDGMVKII